MKRLSCYFTAVVLLLFVASQFTTTSGQTTADTSVLQHQSNSSSSSSSSNASSSTNSSSSLSSSNTNLHPDGSTQATNSSTNVNSGQSNATQHASSNSSQSTLDAALNSTQTTGADGSNSTQTTQSGNTTSSNQHSSSSANQASAFNNSSSSNSNSTSKPDGSGTASQNNTNSANNTSSNSSAQQSSSNQSNSNQTSQSNQTAGNNPSLQSTTTTSQANSSAMQAAAQASQNGQSSHNETQASTSSNGGSTTGSSTGGNGTTLITVIQAGNSNSSTQSSSSAATNNASTTVSTVSTVVTQAGSSPTAVVLPVVDNKVGADCSAGVNLCFAIDGSGSLSQADLMTEVSWTSAVVQEIDSKSKNKFMSTYSGVLIGNTGTVLSPNTQDVDAFLLYIQGAGWGGKGVATNIGQSLEVCADMLRSASPSSASFIVLLTDGNPNVPGPQGLDPVSYAFLTAQGIKANNISILSVLVEGDEGVNKTLLQLMASSNRAGPLLFSVAGFESLDQVSNSIVLAACGGGTTLLPGQDVQINGTQLADLNAVVNQTVTNISSSSSSSSSNTSAAASNYSSYVQQATAIQSGVQGQLQHNQSSNNSSSSNSSAASSNNNSSSNSSSTIIVVLPGGASPKPNYPGIISPVPGGNYKNCSAMPVCRLYLEDVVCCDNLGLISARQSVYLTLLCNTPVAAPSPECLMVTGTENYTVTAVWPAQESGTAFRFLLNYSNATYLGLPATEFNGSLTVGFEASRQDYPEQCSLNLTEACTLGGALYQAPPPVSELSYFTVNSMSYYYNLIGNPWQLDLLDGFAWEDLDAAGQCKGQRSRDLPADFFEEGWVDYNDGYDYNCTLAAPNCSVAASVLG